MEVIASHEADGMTDIKILRADLSDQVHQRDIVSMMDAYARDPMGDGKPLSQYARDHLIEGLLGHPTTIVPGLRKLHGMRHRNLL